MILAFRLSMPNRGSWNGGWSGEDQLYVRTRTFRNGSSSANAAQDIIGRHYYHWNDGWSACVEVKEVNAADARRLRKRSVGFCGYDWMIKSLLRYGKIKLQGG